MLVLQQQPHVVFNLHYYTCLGLGQTWALPLSGLLERLIILPASALANAAVALGRAVSFVLTAENLKVRVR